ncbi:metallophosphoesterase family protein [Schaalia sp. lx-260]|uniref:metallophosphoesterase family protein n=1 Tax=Schaalia sp. lx-260 TaxID=2899082 RepID=UPI001E5DE6B1|nr:exonuclease SbcCD subunit D C-terminal domain-containing protein [Schaalia sp. lx-260]MCD4549270.1 exonuclease SbcCD subunit D C-terminal domain-containing protein [Schaalia sp. lx-260]
MRILHTSDWHFGRSLHGVDLHEAVDLFTRWLIDCVKERDVDVVLISGDIFDRALPPVSSVRQLSYVLEELCRLCTVILTPGNHDSATRLGFVSQLLSPRLRIVSDIHLIGQAIDINATDGSGVLIYPIPYLEPDLVRTALRDSDSNEPIGRSHEAVIQAAVKRIRHDLARRRLEGDDRPAACMVHAFIVGGSASDSERDIHVGGVDSIPASIFDLTVSPENDPNAPIVTHGFDYIAAGHLHRPQNIHGASVPIRYSGSPLAYSFSEAGTAKSVTLIECDAHQIRHIEILDVPVYRPLAVITDSMDELLCGTYEDMRQHWLSINVTDSSRPSEMVPRLREYFPYALVIMHTPEHVPDAQIARTHDIRTHSVHQILHAFFTDVGGASLTAHESAALNDVVADLRIKEQQ